MAFTLHKLPDDIDLKLAALIEPLAVACHDVRRSGLKAGEVAVVLGVITSYSIHYTKLYEYCASN